MEDNVSSYRVFLGEQMITILAGALLAASGQIPELVVESTRAGSVVRYSDGLSLRTTGAKVASARSIEIPGSPVRIAMWNEGSKGVSTPYYAISLDGRTVHRVTPTSYNVELQYGSFDPAAKQPSVPNNLSANANNEIFIVQFHVQPLQEFRDGIESAGGSIKSYLTNHAYLVQMDSDTKTRVSALGFVRAIVPYHPAYRTDAGLRAKIANGTLPASQLYNIQAMDYSNSTMKEMIGTIEMLGGEVTRTITANAFLTARLDPEQFVQLLHLNEVSFADLWSQPQPDMNLLRQLDGVDAVNTFGTFAGAGLRGAVMDGGIVQNHVAWATRMPILQTAVTVNNHGTACFGINFGDGTGNASGKGVLPLGQGIFAAYTGYLSGAGDRNALTAGILTNQGCYQSNSWGDTLGTTYTTISAQMDSILYNNDIVILQSQSNAGTTSSRPQAWAKNIVSVGGIKHLDNLNWNDDNWTNGASTGPAADGRIKPDISNAYDLGITTYTTTTTGYANFSGTSQATPLSAGLFGVMYQMWGQGYFGNSCLGSSFFANRPKAPLAKALMVNTARLYDSAINTDIIRVRQGWGVPNVENLWNARNGMFIVNETDVLTNLQTKSYRLYVAAGTPQLKITMAYLDPAGTVGAGVARKNNLSLKVTSPSGTVYWGNFGMGTTSNVSVSAGAVENNVDTVENVFLLAPATGTWIVDVIGSDINTDARVETVGTIDADFALVASGVTYSLAPTSFTAQFGSLVSGGLNELNRSENAYMVLGEPTNSENIEQTRTLITRATSPTATISKIEFQIEARTGRPLGRAKIEAWNFSTNSWTSFGYVNFGLTDSVSTVGTSVNASNYVNPSTREMRLRTTFGDPDTGVDVVWSANVEQIRFLVNP